LSNKYELDISFKEAKVKERQIEKFLKVMEVDKISEFEEIYRFVCILDKITNAYRKAGLY